MTASYFDSGPDGFEPSAMASGPWSPDMLHGRLLGGLAARAIEAAAVDEGWRVARLTVDLFRPAAMAPVHVSTSVVRQGRRIRVVDADLVCDGHAVARASAVILVEGEEPPGHIWRPPSKPWPDPESLPDDEIAGGEGADGGSKVDELWLVRTVTGGFGTGQRTRVWTNDTASLVDGEPLSPLVRAAVSGDLACPLANSGDQGLHYINSDYTLTMGRYPRGPWIGLEVAQQLDASGISMGSSTLVDLEGPFAISTGVSLVRPPLDPIQ